MILIVLVETFWCSLCKTDWQKDDSEFKNVYIMTVQALFKGPQGQSCSAGSIDTR